MVPGYAWDRNAINIVDVDGTVFRCGMIFKHYFHSSDMTGVEETNVTPQLASGDSSQAIGYFGQGHFMRHFTF